MRQIKLGTALLTILIITLVLAIIAQQRRAAIREARLLAEIRTLQAKSQSHDLELYLAGQELERLYAEAESHRAEAGKGSR